LILDLHERAIKDPAAYPEVAAQLSQYGIKLPENNPGAEVLAHSRDMYNALAQVGKTPGGVEAKLKEAAALAGYPDYSPELLKDPKYMKRLDEVMLGRRPKPEAKKDSIGDIIESFGMDRNDPQARKDPRVLKARRVQLGVEKADESAASNPEASLPSGVKPEPGKIMTSKDIEETSKVVGATSSVVGLIDELNALVYSGSGVGREVFPTEVAQQAKALATSIRLKLKEAESLGAIDKGSSEVLAALVPEDPTAVTDVNTDAQLKQVLDNVITSARSQLSSRKASLDERASMRQRRQALGSALQKRKWSTERIKTALAEAFPEGAK
jgi:hypothetical protein